MGFIDIKLIDVIDIFVVALVLFQIYRVIKGTNALRIVIGIVIFYLISVLVKAVKMELLSMILGQVIGVGVIALIVVFQQEIRRFLLMLGTRYSQGRKTFLGRFFKSRRGSEAGLEWIDPVTDACADMSGTKTGALIVIARAIDTSRVMDTGVRIDAVVSAPLLKSIFFKNSPLHDGAVILVNNRIKTAKCILPITEKEVIPSEFGMRHRAALGMSETSDALVIVVSEETGAISVARKGHVRLDLTPIQLRSHLRRIMSK